MLSDEKIYLNGIDARTGQYLVDPMTYDFAAELVKSEPTDKAKESLMRQLWRTTSEPHLGLPFPRNPEFVEQAGWGIVFHKDEDAAVKAALEPLIEHRRKQIKDSSIVKILEYKDESVNDWLAGYGVGRGSIYPDRVPYYLLIIGSPQKIPFLFGHELDVEYAVGRLHFDATADYSAYIRSVIDYETSPEVPNSKDVVFFGPRHAFDPATQMSADLLVNPLADGTAGGGGLATPTQGVAQRWGYRARKLWGDDAKKGALAEVFNPVAQVKSPALLFTATHGMGFPLGDPNQEAQQGALLCQDWPGFGNLTADHYFSASDLSSDAHVHGLIAFNFACFGAGTPRFDRFTKSPGNPPEIAKESFLAALPKKLLTHPNGGALACIGHVERAWGYSIVTPNAGAQILPFDNGIARILVGQPIGHAMKDFNERYAALSTSLASLLEQVKYKEPVSNYELASAWIGRNDAEGYVVIGDPAVKLRVTDLK
ncbi:MAG: C25 family cysteine peptidase [Blastocatellia bacterium]